MKRLTILLLVLVGVSCTRNLESLNTNIKDATTASAEAFFNTATKNMADLMFAITYGASGAPYETTPMLVQHIASVTYNEGTTYYSQFNWSTIYLGVLKNLDESAKVTAAIIPVGQAGEIQKKNQAAIVEVMVVYAYSRLVESFGDIPYSDALDADNVLPTYDKAETVYADLIKRLSAAINNLNTAGKGFDGDLVYKGNVSNWKKFANSLKLKMGMRIIDKDLALGTATVQEAAPGAFKSNAEIAQFKYLNAQPNTNPLWISLAVGNRKDFVACKPLTDLMNALNDPRRAVFFEDKNGQYLGAPSGAVVTFEQYSEYDSTNFYNNPGVPGILLDYASVEFLLAEAAERSIIGTPANAESHYNAAISASLDYYLNKDAFADIPADVPAAKTAYLSQPGVAYTTAAGNWKEKIGKQKWIALFNQSVEAWTEYRRLDYPDLKAPVGSFVNVVPKRLTYPISEQTLNSVNYKAASTSVGSDLLTTKLFFDVY